MQLRKLWQKRFRSSPLPFIYPPLLISLTNNQNLLTTSSPAFKTKQIYIWNQFFLAFEAAKIFLDLLWKENFKFRAKIQACHFFPEIVDHCKKEWRVKPMQAISPGYFTHHSLIDGGTKIIKHHARLHHCYFEKQSNGVHKIYCAKFGAFLKVLARAEKESS